MPYLIEKKLFRWSGSQKFSRFGARFDKFARTVVRTFEDQESEPLLSDTEALFSRKTKIYLLLNKLVYSYSIK